MACARQFSATIGKTRVVSNATDSLVEKDDLYGVYGVGDTIRVNGGVEVKVVYVAGVKQSSRLEEDFMGNMLEKIVNLTYVAAVKKGTSAESTAAVVDRCKAFFEGRYRDLPMYEYILYGVLPPGKDRAERTATAQAIVRAITHNNMRELKRILAVNRATCTAKQVYMKYMEEHPVPLKKS